MTAVGWRLEVEGLSKKEKGVMDMDSSVVTTGVQWLLED